MEEKKILGMPKNVCFGLAWLTLVVGIVALAVDYKKMDKKEKQNLVSLFVIAGVMIIIGTVLGIINAIIVAAGGIGVVGIINAVINLLIYALCIFVAVKAFMNDYVEVPVAFQFAGNFVKEAAPEEEVKAEEKAEEEVQEETKEAAPEEEAKAEEPAQEEEKAE